MQLDQTPTKPRKAKTEIQTIERLSFDLGNRFNAITNGKLTKQYPSYVRNLSSKQDLDFSHKSFQEHQSFRVDIGALSFVVGEVAQGLGARPTFGSDKWLRVKEFLYPALIAIGIEQNTHIKELRCTIPNDQDLSQRTPFQSLANKAHQFKINGEEFTIQIDDIIIMPEGLPAWIRAVKDELYKYPDFPNAVLDLGGGTAIARIVTSQGVILRDKELVLRGGTSTLASSIASELDMPGTEGQIMDAIANGSFQIAFTNFKHIFDAQLSQWVEAIKAEIKTSWQSFENEFAQILVVGGSAPIFAPFVGDNKRYIIAPEPQTFALRGLQDG